MTLTHTYKNLSKLDLRHLPLKITHYYDLHLATGLDSCS